MNLKCIMDAFFTLDLQLFDIYTFMIFNLYYISCTYVKPMNCMVLGNKQYNLLHQLKKWRDDPEITKKFYFCFLFWGVGWVENMPSPNIRTVL